MVSLVSTNGESGGSSINQQMVAENYESEVRAIGRHDRNDARGIESKVQSMGTSEIMSNLVRDKS